MAAEEKSRLGKITFQIQSSWTGSDGLSNDSTETFEVTSYDESTYAYLRGAAVSYIQKFAPWTGEHRLVISDVTNNREIIRVEASYDGLDFLKERPR